MFVEKLNITNQHPYYPFRNGTTYKDSEGNTRKRVAFPNTQRGNNYCARSFGQKRTTKVKARRYFWGCKGKKSYPIK
jgi:hypothetical protein